MWTVEETNRLYTLQTGMKTVGEIAVELHKPPLDVENKLLSLGFKPLHKRPGPEQTSFNVGKAVEIPQKKRRTRVTPEIEKRVCELREQRFKFSEIAKKTGLDCSTCSRIAKRNGLPIEKRYVETKEPAPVAAKTSSDTTPNAAICKELIIQARNNLQNIEDISCAICADAHRIGHALGLLEAALKIMEV